MAGELDGRVALVTGAGRGIGRAIAVTLARAGARVALAARDEAQLAETAALVAAEGGEALTVATDLRLPDEVSHLARTVAERLGPVDVLVNNAGIAGPTKPLLEIEPAEWEETLRVNLTGTFLVTRAVLGEMVARGSGSVVCIGSVTGKVALPGRTPYAASKLGLVGLVRTLATEVGPSGVRVNLVSPGAVAGPRLDGVLEQQAQARGIAFEAMRDEIAARAPLHRFVTPEAVAEAVLYLASDRADCVTGADLNVTAGLAMH